MSGGLAFDVAHLLAGGMVLASFMLLYQDRLPALVNVFIAFFKATSIVVVVGIFDLMTAAKRAAADAQWQGFGTEIYLFVAAIYFVFCWAMSRYSAWLQRR